LEDMNICVGQSRIRDRRKEEWQIALPSNSV